MDETTGNNNANTKSAKDNSKVENVATATATESANKANNQNPKGTDEAKENIENSEDSKANNQEDSTTDASAELNESNSAEHDANNQISKLQAQLSDVSNKYLRALADIDNNKKRVEKALQDTRIFAITNFAKELIVMLDIFDKAFVGLKVEEITDNNLKNFAIGMQLTQKELLKTLEKFGIQKIYPLNEKFNPNLHEALFSKTDESLENGTIFEVNESGYLLQERLLRPAKVGIIKNEKA